MTREWCKSCNKPIRIGFSVPDQIWKRVVLTKFLNATLCLECFTIRADEMLVPWDEEIEFYPVSLKTHLNLDKTP